ncbi:MAG: ABC transporter permease [Anaerolineae bacterium]|nr:ABC transporter permease [Anaerolineae bacterium]
MSTETFNLKKSGNFLARYGTFTALILITLAFGLFVPKFASFSNIMTLLVQISMLSIVASGLTAVFVVGELDISTGAVVSLGGILGAYLMNNQIPPAAAIVATLLVGVVFGVVNGFIVGYLRIPALLGTFGTSVIALGLNFWAGNGSSIRISKEVTSEFFMSLGSGTFVGIPIPFVVALMVFIFFLFLLEHTKWGLRMYSVGGNQEAATNFGINNRRMKFTAFVFCGLTAAIAGLLLSSRLGAGSPIAGDAYTLDAIAAVYVGVSMFREGEPHLFGSVLGVLIFGILVNGMRLMGVGYEVQSILRGIFILGAVAIAGNRAQLRVKLF